MQAYKKKGGGNMIFMILMRDDTSNLLLKIIHLNFFIKLVKMEKINFKKEFFFIG